jgi:hypothetical protein
MTAAQEQMAAPEPCSNVQDAPTSQTASVSLASNRMFGRGKSLSWAAVIVLLTGLWIALTVIYGLTRFGSIPGALAYLQGVRLIPDAYAKSFGAVPSGSQPKIGFAISNYSNNPYRILGMRSSCTCLLTEGDFPVVIQSGAQFTFAIEVRDKSKKQPVNESITLYTDQADQPELVLQVSGTFYQQ